MTAVKVFIFPNFDKAHSEDVTLKACSILDGLGCEIMLPTPLSLPQIPPGVKLICPERGASECDVMISVGGDGTILKCARLASKYGKKLLGINCGRLGFMATLERDELSKLSKLISGDYGVDERMMLKIEVRRENGYRAEYTALNEAVISSGYVSGIRDFTVLADGFTVSSLRADGLIFSTPTGASAYSLSAGGPLIEPSLDCIEFTQICPHSLFARTMLFSPLKKIEVRFEADTECEVSLVADGQEPVRLSARDKVIISRSDMRLSLIDIGGDGYFRAVNRKLMQPAKQTGE